VERDAEFVHPLGEHVSAPDGELLGHGMRCELDHVDLEAECEKRVRSFEA
jgi:hypothetical protein